MTNKLLINHIPEMYNGQYVWWRCRLFKQLYMSFFKESLPNPHHMWLGLLCWNMECGIVWRRAVPQAIKPSCGCLNMYCRRQDYILYPMAPQTITLGACLLCHSTIQAVRLHSPCMWPVLLDKLKWDLSGNTTFCLLEHKWLLPHAHCWVEALMVFGNGEGQYPLIFAYDPLLFTDLTHITVIAARLV